MNVDIRTMTEYDYERVKSLWMTIKGFGIRSIDDSKEGVVRFLRRNPTTSVIAICEGEVVGAILCGHDGRTGFFYHVCVREDKRRKGIGKKMVLFAMKALQREHVNKISLVAFVSNSAGNAFWKHGGWTKIENYNTYEFYLNEENITSFNQ